jgi:hypothetical protein
MLGGVVDHFQVGGLEAQEDGRRLSASYRGGGRLCRLAHARSLTKSSPLSILMVDRGYTCDILSSEQNGPGAATNVPGA